MPQRELPPSEVIRQLLEYDPETGLFTWRPRTVDWFRSEAKQRDWNDRWAGRKAFGAQNGNGYFVCDVLGRKIFAHRAAWAYVTGEWPSVHIDHINGCKTDNRAANLRAVSVVENHRNMAKRTDNKSGRVGVCMCRRVGKWKAYISLGGKHKHLGHFANFEDAVAARERAERLHGFHENHGRAA